MTKAFKIFIGLCMAAFIALGIFAVKAIGDISINYEGGRSMDENYLAVRIAEELARQEGVLFLETGADFAAVDPETLLGEFVVTALPKEYRDDSKAEVTIHGQSVPMQLRGGSFEARFALPLGTPPEEYRIALTTGGLTRTEQFWSENNSYFSHGCDVFCSNLSSGSGTGTGGAKPGKHSIDLNFYFEGYTLPFGDKAVSVRLYAEENGKVLYDKPMPFGGFNDTPTFDFKRDAPIDLYAEAKGESGLTYQYFLQRMELQGDELWVNSSREGLPFLRISTPEGKTAEIGY